LEDAKALDNLKSFLLEEGFYLRLKSVFTKLKDEYKYITQTIKEIDAAIKLVPK
jgi:CRISPR/Cas system-associated protein endoribonuclease Cas2